MFTIVSCSVVGLGLVLELGLGLDLVSCCLLVMHTYMCYFRFCIFAHDARHAVSNEPISSKSYYSRKIEHLNK